MYKYILLLSVSFILQSSEENVVVPVNFINLAPFSVRGSYTGVVNKSFSLEPSIMINNELVFKHQQTKGDESSVYNTEISLQYGYMEHKFLLNYIKTKYQQHPKELTFGIKVAEKDYFVYPIFLSANDSKLRVYVALQSQKKKFAKL